MKIITAILAILITSSCMNDSRSYKDINRKVNIPEKLYEGKELKMAKAIYNGNIPEIEHLINIEKIDPNGMSSKGEIRFLDYSIMMENIPVMSKLLELGADPNEISPNHGRISAPIAKASARLNLKMLKLLFKYNVNPNPEIGSLPLKEAIIGDGGKKTIEYLLSQGVNINHQQYLDCQTASHVALSLNKFDYVNFLLDQGANPTIVNSHGKSLAYYVQQYLEEGLGTEERKRELLKLKNRLEKNFNIKFPVKINKIRGLEIQIKKYEDLSDSSKNILGNTDKKMYEKLKEELKNK